MVAGSAPMAEAAYLFIVGARLYVGAMAFTMAEMRLMTDDELVLRHDRMARNTGLGQDHLTQEIDRRAKEREAAAVSELAIASNRLAVRSFWLGVTSTVLSAVATVAAVLALVIR